MSSIPIAALGLGGEASNQKPISYGKSRVSGSQNTSYILHCKGACMPGQLELFTTNSLSKVGINAEEDAQNIRNAFRIEKVKNLPKKIISKFLNDPREEYTYNQFFPYDDESLNIAIKASYRQVYGNFYAMESERPLDSERRLRNGDITIREFIRQLAKSSFYYVHYFQRVNQQRCIELNFKHLLGRPPNNQEEIISNIELMHKHGFEYQLNSLIDSIEYQEAFGENIVPFQRCWNSPFGITTSSFNNTATLTRSYATSDNAIHAMGNKDNAQSGQSQLLKSLASKTPQKIEIPSHMKTLSSEKPTKSEIPDKVISNNL